MRIFFHSTRLFRHRFHSLIVSGILLSTLPALTHAQITLDGTLGPQGPLTGPDYTIDAQVGQLRGNNLFHSFGQFNVQTGESATFTGPQTVENVIGRVTGGQQSFIDGQIRSEMSQANLYLLNPSGVLFGPNATLDVPGSFHVSTADYLTLGDNGRFDATTPSNSVLTSAPPAAFGFLSSNPASIVIQGSSLRVPEGKTLSVIGGDLQMTGGSLSAPHGQINLASVASVGEVIPTVSEHGPDLKMEGFNRLGTIEASQGAHINTDGVGGGSVVIRGGRLIVDNAIISSNTQGNVDGARVGVDAQLAEDVVISNAGRIETTTSPNSTGTGGSTALTVKQLTLTDGARIDTSTSGSGQGGTLSVTATDSISISGRDSKGAKGGLFSNALGKGNGGKVSVSASTLTMADRGTIDAHTAGDGNAGDVEVQAGTLTLTGGAQIQASSGVIESKEGVLTSNGTGGPGRGGDVIVTATEAIAIAGRDSDGNYSGLLNGTVNKGDAGRLSISAPILQMDEGRIFASTLGDGDAGNIDVQVGQLTLTGGAGIVTNVGIRQFADSRFPQINTGGPGRGVDRQCCRVDFPLKW
jgi:filamentous hemagglutinin family protein